ncbi:MAG: hypothetical protein RBT47_10965, partial [Anaerolineae bacterium]|nr:hypothetical protein [Anaerolineae bacterium]
MLPDKVDEILVSKKEYVGIDDPETIRCACAEVAKDIVDENTGFADQVFAVAFCGDKADTRVMLVEQGDFLGRVDADNLKTEFLPAADCGQLSADVVGDKTGGDLDPVGWGRRAPVAGDVLRAADALHFFQVALAGDGGFLGGVVTKTA